MKLIRNIALLSCSLLLTVSCNDVFDVETPDLEVSVKEMTCRVGEKVVFDFSGSADMISFFPGDSGHVYQYRNEGRKLAIESLKMNFATTLNHYNQKHSLSVLLSTDFNGNDTDKSSILSAHWQDITLYFTLATSRTERESGDLPLDDYLEEGKPIYVAFKYTIDTIQIESNASQWSVTRFSIRGESVSGQQTVGDISATRYSAGFDICDFAEGTSLKGNSSVSSTQIRLQGKMGPTERDNQIWAVSNGMDPFYVATNPDVSIAVKGIADAQPVNYSYTYGQPGDYTVYFVAANKNVQNTREVVREVNVKIIP